MKTKIDVYELALKLSKLYECRFVTFSDGRRFSATLEDGCRLDADGWIFVQLSDIKPKWVRDPYLIDINNYWLVINGRELFVDFELEDTSNKYTTNGVIDFSKCMFEFKQRKS